MAPAFLSLKDLRRRSRASFRTENSNDTSSDGTLSHETNDTTPSSGSLTPPSHLSDPALNLQVKDSNASGQYPAQAQNRPMMVPGGNSSRYSVSGMSGLGSPAPNGRTNLPVSQYAPRVQNIAENAWVYQKVLLLHGTIGETEQNHLEGTVIVSKLDDSFPPTSWPVCNSHFKALVYLQPGPNKIRIEFSSPKLANSSSSNPIHVSYLTLHMVPSLNAPPLQLAILLGKDSPGIFDATPSRAEREGNGLDTAVKKFRMAAYLWQAFTAEQMWRHKLGRRTFRFEEEWTSGSANYRDRESGIMRSEARVHIIRSDKTVAELQDLNKAQQYDKATDKNALFDIASAAVKKHLNPLPGQKQYVAVLLLDAHWDKDVKTIRGHAALGGGSGELQLGIFGSHSLHSYPGCFEEVVPAFTDCTPTDTAYVANDCNEAGSSWEAANIGIGAHLHEVGHLFGCPHQEGGIMLRDYVVLNRSFVAREAYSTRTKLPNDTPTNPDESVQAFAIDGGNVLAVAQTGISFIEIYGEGDDVCRAWIEYIPDNNSPIQRQVTMIEQDLRARLPEAKRKGRVKVSVKSHGGGSLDIDDFKAFASKQSSVKLPGGKVAFRCKSLGESKMQGSEPHEVVFTSALKQDRVMSRVIRKKLQANHTFNTSDVRRGEYLSGFVVRAGFWIDGIQLLTSLGRKSAMFGKAHGGSAHTLIPPRGYSICGVAGTCGAWLDGFSILIKH
ncbi:hypothetical protein TrVFT333_003791 [Trichoderma virens FT-333]|nr:hypothetical protein TrVFT333_003791 [Trichoderma virens FT-333]